MKNIILLTIMSGVFLFLSYQTTRALFTDAASITGNTFTAASEFPSPTTEEEEPPSEPTGGEPTPTEPEENVDHIVISEIQITGGTGNSENDFIELYNPTANEINLSQYTLVKRIKTDTSNQSVHAFTSSEKIPAHGYYLWANSAGNFASSIQADFSSSATLTDDNSIAIVKGTSSSTDIIDAVAYGSGHTSPLVENTAFMTNPQANQSIERKAYSSSTISTMSGVDSDKGNGYDSNNNNNDFVLRSASQPQNNSSTPEIQ